MSNGGLLRDALVALALGAGLAAVGFVLYEDADPTASDGATRASLPAVGGTSPRFAAPAPPVGPPATGAAARFESAPPAVAASPAFETRPETLEALRALARGPLARLRVHARPRPLGGFAIRNPDGARVVIEQFQGQVTVVNFWARWCKPCIHELPHLATLAEAVAEDGARVLAINLDRRKPKRSETLLRRRTGGRLAFYRDPTGESVRAAGFRGLPTTLLLDRSGAEVARLSGYLDWGSSEAQALIRRLAAN